MAMLAMVYHIKPICHPNYHPFLGVISLSSRVGRDNQSFSTQISMGDLQDPTDGGTLVPYVWPYFVGISPEI